MLKSSTDLSKKRICVDQSYSSKAECSEADVKEFYRSFQKKDLCRLQATRTCWELHLEAPLEKRCQKTENANQLRVRKRTGMISLHFAMSSKSVEQSCIAQTIPPRPFGIIPKKNHAQTDPYSKNPRTYGPTLDDSQVNHPFKHQTQILTMGSSLGLLSSPTLILRARL